MRLPWAIIGPTIPQYQTLTSGSPAWITYSIKSSYPVNFIRFDYIFKSNAEGLLSVTFDNEIIFLADERYEHQGVKSSRNIPTNTTKTGIHTLAFRLDPFSATQSQIEISNVEILSMLEYGVANQTPIANAGTNQTVAAGTLVHLNGTDSNDPDNWPSSLTFTWTQSSGPAIALNDANTSTPNLTPTEPGNYVFSLTVSDGAASSSADSVTITVDALAANPPEVLQLLEPNGGEIYKAGKKMAIHWNATNFTPKQKMQLKWSKNGGAKWKLLKAVKNKGATVWKPKRSQVTDQARLMICVPKTKKSKALCDVSDGSFAIVR